MRWSSVACPRIRSARRRDGTEQDRNTASLTSSLHQDHRTGGQNSNNTGLTDAWIYRQHGIAAQISGRLFVR